MNGPLQFNLGNEMLAGLYRSVLVDMPASTFPELSTVKHLGGFAQQVCVFVQEPDHIFLPEEKLAFLLKMLGACKLSMGDVAIVNLAGQQEDMAAILQLLQAHKAISFGDHPADSPLTIETRFEMPFLQAPSLELLMTETAEAKAMKIMLWGCLKQLFAVLTRV